MPTRRTRQFYQSDPNSFTAGMLAQRLELPLNTARLLLVSWLDAGKVEETSGRGRYRIRAYRSGAAA